LQVSTLAVAPSRYLLECFWEFIGTATDAGAFKHTRDKMSTISFRIYLLRGQSWQNRDGVIRAKVWRAQR